MELTDINEVRRLLFRHGIKLSKGLGQNFLVNPTVCPKMAELSGIDGDTGVIEIGPGIGVLTVELARRAKRVAAIELDRRLEPVLEETLAGLGNAEVLWQDALKTDFAALIGERMSDCGRVCVCANLPYYITSPIIMKLLEDRLPIESITAMVQLEAAQRMCAQVGSRAAGAVTVAVRYYSSPQILFRVSPGSFLPPPNVESAVMRLDITGRSDDGTPRQAVNVTDEKLFFRMVRAGFAQRRKTLINAVCSDSTFPKDIVAAALDELGIDPRVRIEQLAMEQLAALSDLLYRSIHNA